jgi:hypothetical protein
MSTSKGKITIAGRPDASIAALAVENYGNVGINAKNAQIRSLNWWKR